MRTLIAVLLSAAAAFAEANLPAPLKALPRDGLAEQLDADVRRGMEAARGRYQSKDEQDRLAAVDMFEAVPSPLADADLFSIAEEDGWPGVRLRAAEALGRRENRHAPMCAARLAVCGVPPAIRMGAADLVKRSGSEEAEAFLVLVLKNGSLRMLDGKGLGFDRSYNDLEDLLYRTMAATALGRVGSERAVAELVRELGSRDWEMRAAAARALGDTGARDAVGALSRAASDRVVDVAIEAALALGRIGGGEAIRRLEGMGKDDRAVVARMAARALAAARERARAAAAPPAAPPAGAGGGGTEALRAPPTRATPEPPAPIAAPEGSVDLLFLMDATFSMRLNWARVTCQVQEAILRRPMEGEARVGFILYRDFDNQWLTRQRYLSWDLDGALSWFLGESATGANAYAGSASDKALTVAAMLNLRDDHRPHLMVFADAPPNDLSVAVHRSRLLHLFERAVVDGVYLDRDRETRGFMDDIARAGGGISRALRSGGSPLPR